MPYVIELGKQPTRFMYISDTATWKKFMRTLWRIDC